jgi:hypothetical protein
MGNRQGRKTGIQEKSRNFAKKRLGWCRGLSFAFSLGRVWPAFSGLICGKTARLHDRIIAPGDTFVSASTACRIYR